MAGQIEVEPIEGDEYPAELIVFAFPAEVGRSRTTSSAGRVIQGQGWQRTRMEIKKVMGKNVEFVRAETHGEYHPRAVPRRSAATRSEGGAAAGAIVMTDATNYYIRMVGPDKTMKKLTAEFDELLKTIQVGD